MPQYSGRQTFSVTISATIGAGTGHKTVRIDIPLTRPLGSFLRLRHLRMCDQFHRFNLVGPQHIAGELGWVDEEEVRARLCQVARTVQFMDVTGLVPTCEEIYGTNTFSQQHRLPGQDHATTWRDTDTNIIFMLDEPYGYVDHLFPERKNWAERQGLVVHRLDYQGTYRPGCGIVCDLVYRAEQKEFVQEIINRIEKLDSLPKIEDLGRAYLHV